MIDWGREMNTISYYSLKETVEGINKIELVDTSALNGTLEVTGGRVRSAAAKTDPFKYVERLNNRLTQIDEAINCLNFEKQILLSHRDELNK